MIRFLLILTLFLVSTSLSGVFAENQVDNVTSDEKFNNQGTIHPGNDKLNGSDQDTNKKIYDYLRPEPDYSPDGKIKLLEKALEEIESDEYDLDEKNDILIAALRATEKVDIVEEALRVLKNTTSKTEKVRVVEEALRKIEEINGNKDYNDFKYQDIIKEAYTQTSDDYVVSIGGVDIKLLDLPVPDVSPIHYYDAVGDSKFLLMTLLGKYDKEYMNTLMVDHALEFSRGNNQTVQEPDSFTLEEVTVNKTVPEHISNESSPIINKSAKSRIFDYLSYAEEVPNPARTHHEKRNLIENDNFWLVNDKIDALIKKVNRCHVSTRDRQETKIMAYMIGLIIVVGAACETMHVEGNKEDLARDRALGKFQPRSKDDYISYERPIMYYGPQ